ncbi:unnamed protein product [Oreochromis niloticus]|nr:unnamed protein product [Mustela putorius furo]
MVFMMAEPGECFDWDSILKGVVGFAQGMFGKEKAKELEKAMEAEFQNYKRDLRQLEGFVRGYFGKEKAKELVKSLKADFQNYKHLRQREFD